MPAKQRASFKRVYEKSRRTLPLGLLTENDRIGSACSETAVLSSSVNDAMTRMLEAENCRERCNAKSWDLLDN